VYLYMRRYPEMPRPVVDRGPKRAKQASLLLDDVQTLTIEHERRGVVETNPWTADGSPWETQSCVYYMEVEPYLQPRFTDEVLARIQPLLRSLAQRCYLAVPEFLDTRPALPNIDVKTWRESLHKQ
jgi:hypothetical protein